MSAHFSFLQNNDYPVLPKSFDQLYGRSVAAQNSDLGPSVVRRYCYGFVQNSVKQDAVNLVLWAPVLYGGGVLSYFSLTEEPNFITMILLIGVVFIALATGVTTPNKTTRCLAIGLALTIFGFTNSATKSSMLATPTVDENIFMKNITATLEEVRNLPQYKQLILGDIRNSRHPLNKIRITVRTKLDPSVNVGDRVRLSAALYPPPQASSEYGYDFAKFAYFQGISAVGYATSNILLDHAAENRKFFMKIQFMRELIHKKLHKHLNSTQANIISALLIGKKEGISKNVMDTIRNSGIAHLFAISGLHLAFVASMFFGFFRGLIRLSEWMTLRYNIKKFAAVAAIIASFLYLIIAGMPVSAQRAFIMVALIFIAILIDRSYNAMRSIALAAFLILVFEPESLLNPSFQMSFVAVLALISSYGQFNISLNNHLIKYFVSIIISSVIATMATMPYTIYHFNSFSPFGIIANLFAIPIATFIIIPVGIIYVLLMPMNIEWIIAPILRWSIDAILYIADKSASIPNAAIYVKTIPAFAMVIMSLGVLWLCIWQAKWRFVGFVPVVIGALFSYYHETPDILLSGDTIAIKENDEKLYSVTRKNKNFIAQSWAKQNGQKHLPLYKEYTGTNNRFKFNSGIYHKMAATVLIADNSWAVERYCDAVGLIIQRQDFLFPSNCHTRSIRYNTLMKKQSYSIWLDSAGIKIRTNGGNRPWHNVKSS